VVDAHFSSPPRDVDDNTVRDDLRRSDTRERRVVDDERSTDPRR
jgi:hypothetical protein